MISFWYYVVSRLIVCHSQEAKTSRNWQQYGIMHRRVQVFVILCNQCLQYYFWPALNFSGALSIIGLLYALIISQRSLPAAGVACICTMMISTTLVCCSMFHLGSRTIIISSDILKRSKHWNKCKYSKKFLRSCPVIANMMGEFHKMDRKRGPYFIKFILQRTFLLALKTKLSLESGGPLIILVPLCAN